jgi:hypothetical protein
MADQLDKLDQQDFQNTLDKANDCTRVRNFSCSDEMLRKAAKLANGSKDKLALNTATRNLQVERQRVKDEALARAEQARQMQLAEQRRNDELAAEARREEDRAEESRRRAQQEQNDEPGTSNPYAAFAQGMQQSQNFYSGLNKIHNDSMQNINRIVEEKRANERADREQRERNERAAAEQRAQDNERIRQQNAARRQQEQDRQQNLAYQQEQARKQADADAAKLAAQRAEKQEQERQQKLALQQEQTRKQEQERKKAEAAATKLAEQQAQKQASDQYLKSVAAGSRLVATKCPGGEGKYYATGNRPNIKPEVVGCVDIRYRAYCAGSAQFSEGVARNFIGMAGCFGDTYEINPKPDCKVDQVRIEVIEAMPGCKVS